MVARVFGTPSAAQPEEWKSSAAVTPASGHLGNRRAFNMSIFPLELFQDAA